MPMRALVLLASVALVLTTAGVVMRGPIVPVCAVEQPCDEPAKGVTLLFARGDRVVGRVVTDDEGRYRLRLPGGLYTVRRPAAVSVDRKLEPNRVRVFAGRRTNIDFFIDTGI